MVFTFSVAHPPEAISPPVSFCEMGVSCFEEPPATTSISGEFIEYHFMHDTHPYVIPVLPKSDLLAKLLGGAS